MSRNFSLDKLFHKVNRRQSDTSVDPLSPSIIINDDDSQSIRTIRNRARSLSMMPNNSHSSLSSKTSKSPIANRSRSKSLNKKQAKELIKYETNQVISKKLQSLLNELGLQKPTPLKVNQCNSSNLSKNIKIYVANSNNCIYLGPPSSGSSSYEDFENGVEEPIPPTEEEQLEQGDEEEDDEATELMDEEDVEKEDLEVHQFNDYENYAGDLENMPSVLKEKLQHFKSPNYLSTKIDADTPIPHTFGLIIELNKDTAIQNLIFEFSSITNILWPSGDPYNKTFLREKFKIGSIDWIKNLKNADFYLNNLNSHDFKFRKLSPNELAKRTRFYRLFKSKNLSEDNEDDELSNVFSNENEFDDFGEDLSITPYTSNSANSNGEIYKAGLYIFMLPILLPENIPQTITSINGSLNHFLNVSIHKNSEKLNRKLKLKSSYNLPMVRTPPSFANSVADKPIYVNRIWNDSLHYIITFPRKYISLGSEHTINVKIVPLVKDVVIKRVKFNVLERITYVSKNLTKEYDYDGEDPYYLKPLISKDKQRERVISICELKTKNKPSNSYLEPYKEEVIKCPDNNLLFSCYEPDFTTNDDDDIENFKLDSSNKHDKDKNVMIASPLEINIALPFLTTRNDKIIQTNNEEDLKHLPRSNPTSRKASIMSTTSSDNVNNTPSSPIIGSLETNLLHSHNDIFAIDDDEFLTPDQSNLMHEISHNHSKENIQHGFTTIGRALYPDSNYRHIKIHHRLQVCFRISKPDPKDNYKMHHYEVVVDTPLILLSSKCNEESIQLPKYDELQVDSDPLPPLSPSISFRTPDYHPNQGVSKKPSQGFVRENGQVSGNGFSIKPWNNHDDSLPSFEEATSPISSPVMRSFSVSEDPLSRMPSITQDMYPDPPAYEEPDSKKNFNESNPINIDAIVNDKDQLCESPKHTRSRLRSSLVNSFAPTGMSNSSSLAIPMSSNLSVSPTNTSAISEAMGNLDCNEDSSSSLDSNTGDSSSNDDSRVSLNNKITPDPIDDNNLICNKNDLTTPVLNEVKNSISSLSLDSGINSGIPDTSSTGITTDEDVSKTDVNSINDFKEDSDKTPQEGTPMDITLSDVTEIRGSKEIKETKRDPESDSEADESRDEINDINPIKFTAFPNDSESNISIFTQGSFDQRLPLLRNISTESNLPLSKYMETPKFSSDNIITENEPQQEIYHAY
ncbi:putative protoporphyrinogen oxidase [[Candida] jaroonii]|uniref:Protoporphyrinogen oxidase n=1 Tax=[Candida] jaroonii TaxID=467808 RepID=A0ACA9YB36_9ASCO|nr:putative protoporphyrinogen oxidase [[Candida] jaroonii]